MRMMERMNCVRVGIRRSTTWVSALSVPDVSDVPDVPNVPRTSGTCVVGSGVVHGGTVWYDCEVTKVTR